MLLAGRAGGAAAAPACASPRIVFHEELASLAIAHMDCDAFYASVEKRDRPELRDKAVIVGGGKRGVVTTCCYIARIKGVRSAMPMFKALKACPEAVVIKPDFTKYRAESKRILGLAGELTPLIQNLSLDEAWMDLSGTERLHGRPAGRDARQAAGADRGRRPGSPSPLASAANKFLAKIASDLDKPRGFSVIGSEAQAFLAPKPVGILPGVGPAMVASLLRGRLPDGRRPRPRRPQGPGRAVRDPRPAPLRPSPTAATAAPSIRARNARGSAPRPPSSRTSRPSATWRMCWPGSARRSPATPRADGHAGRVVTLKLRTTDFRIVTRRRTIAVPTQTAKTLFAVGRELLAKEADGRPYRLIGIGIAELVEAGAVEDDFFGGRRATRAGRRKDPGRHPRPLWSRGGHLGAHLSRKGRREGRLTALKCQQRLTIFHSISRFSWGP